MSSEWTLGDVAEIVMGQSPAGEFCNSEGSGLPLLNGPTEFGATHPYPVQFTTDPKKIAEPKDLLFCVRGSTTGRMNWADQRYAIGRGIAAVRGKRAYPGSFIRALIETNLDSLLLKATGSTFPNVSRDLLTGISIPKTTEDEAISIASVLEPIDGRITLLRETNATLEAIAQAIFKSWFVDFDPVKAKEEGRTLEGMDEETAALFPDSFEESEFGMIPRGWCAANMSYLIALHKGTVTPKNHPNEVFQHFSLPAYDAGNMPMDEKGSAIQSNKTTVPEDAVLISKLNPHIPRIWLPAVVEKNAVCSTEFLPFVPTQDNRPAFVYCLLSTPELHASICQLATGTSNSHQRIKPDGILSLPATVPPVGVISKFNDVASPLLDRVKENRLIIQSLSSLRDTLLPRLINGQIRLRDSVVSK